MNLKILFMLLIYYIFISLAFVTSGGILTDSGATQNVELNNSDLGSNETTTGGIFGSGVSFARYFVLVGFGVGLPSDFPYFFRLFWIAWQTLITIFTVGFIISSIWDG